MHNVVAHSSSRYHCLVIKLSSFLRIDPAAAAAAAVQLLSSVRGWPHEQLQGSGGGSPAMVRVSGESRGGEDEQQRALHQ